MSGIAGRKGKYEEWLTPDGLLLLKSYAREGLTDKEIAEKKIGVSERAFTEWKMRFDSISAALKKGREPINTIVEDTFFETKLKSQTITETITEKTIHRDADGLITGSTEHIRKAERYIPADTTAMLFYMKCRMPEKYNDRLNVTIDNAKELPKLYQALEADNDVREAVEEAETDI